MPKPACGRSLNDEWVQHEVCRTFLGRGMGISITAQGAPPSGSAPTSWRRLMRSTLLLLFLLLLALLSLLLLLEAMDSSDVDGQGASVCRPLDVGAREEMYVCM